MSYVCSLCLVFLLVVFIYLVILHDYFVIESNNLAKTFSWGFFYINSQPYWKQIDTYGYCLHHIWMSPDFIFSSSSLGISAFTDSALLDAIRVDFTDLGYRKELRPEIDGMFSAKNTEIAHLKRWGKPSQLATDQQIARLTSRGKLGWQINGLKSNALKGEVGSQ